MTEDPNKGIDIALMALPNQVAIRLDRPVNILVFAPADAERLGQDMIQAAFEARKRAEARKKGLLNSAGASGLIVQ